MKHVLHRFRNLVAVSAVLAVLAGCGTGSQSLSTYEAEKQAELEQIKAGRFDGGRMWTFEYPPIDYFQQT